QLDDTLARIPADGRLPVPPNQPILVQSSSEPIQMVLPDRTKLLLDINTLVEIALPGDDASETRIGLNQGRLLVQTADTPATIISPWASLTLPPGSSAGLFLPPDGNQLTVDCLTDNCLVQSGVSQTAADLSTGQSALVQADGRIYPTPSADYARYVSLANAIANVITPTPTPTFTPTLTVTTTMTATPSATVPPTPLILSFRQNRLEIGRSVNGVPIEAIQLSQGSHPVLFVGGIHAGYAPNALALVEAIVTHFQAHPEEIPADIALYVIPNLNPDSPDAPGVVDGRLNANGVDLNRNWDCRWQANNNILGTFIANSGGVSPVSEPESQALHAFIQAVAPQAVIFWGSGGRGTGLASPGACDEISLVSAPLAQAYGRAADFNFVDGPIVQADTTLNGDVTNWLDKIGIPAAFIILPRFQDYDWEQNYAGIQAVFDVIINGALTAITPGEPGTPAVLPTPTACAITPTDQWANSYATYRVRLGCALNTAVTPTAAYQPYANGLMIWRQDKEQVYILYQDGSLSTHTVNDPALANFYVSDLLKGAFGYLWQNNTAVRTRLGQPQAQEQIASAFTVQDFGNGAIFSFADIGSHTYLLLFPETSWLYP
ncbi:MAG TPA: M14 family metallopeptidase, partial [Chloroflexota bacterium]|nr:M14 family metallopeptidase [Chloroflexota bacterium]